MGRRFVLVGSILVGAAVASCSIEKGRVTSEGGTATGGAAGSGAGGTTAGSGAAWTGGVAGAASSTGGAAKSQECDPEREVFENGECRTRCVEGASGPGIYSGSHVSDSEVGDRLLELDGMWCVTGDVHISVSRDDYDEAASLREIVGDLEIGQSWGTNVSLDAFQGLERIGGELYLRGLSTPRSFTGFRGLVQVHTIHVRAPEVAVSNFSGFDQITELPGALHLEGFYSGPPFYGLSNVEHIGALILYEARAPALTGLEAVQTIGEVQLLGSRTLETFAGAPSLESIETLLVESDDEISLADLATVDITQSVTLRGTTLTTLDGLQAVDKLESLIIEDNASLTDLSALGLAGGASEMTIRNNAALPQCEVDALLARSGSTCLDCSGNTGAGDCN